MSRKVKYFLVISLLAVAVFLSVGFATTQPGDWPFARGESYQRVQNLSGPLGSLLAYFCFSLLGRLFAWFVPLCMVVVAIGIAGNSVRAGGRILAKSGVIILLVNSLFSLISFTRDSEVLSGTIGHTVGSILSTLLGRIGGTIIVITCLLLVLLSEVRFLVKHGSSFLGRRSFRPPSMGWVGGALQKLGQWVKALFVSAVASWSRWRETRRSNMTELREPEEVAPEPPEQAPWIEPEKERHPPPVRAKRVPERRPKPAPKRPVSSERTIPLEDAVLPSLTFLGVGGGGGTGFSQDKLKAWSEVLEDKLSNYAIEGRVTAVNQGPLVTTFEFEPAPGVKIKEIVSRSDDLSLAMRARSLRLIAPIPGRAVVGIEIPNPDQDMVYLGDVLREIPDRLRLSGLMIALGVDAVGKPFYVNLCSAPHLLMAGTTGSGKSVSLNCLLASILFQYRPADVRLLLVDPKMVELSIFDGIPHLLHPVITDPREAVRVFTYLIGEMERRNELFRKNGVKNIESFNSKVALGRVDGDDALGKLPYIVLVVDELGDLVLTKGADIESLLSRLSNMARAVGIHMIVATQRPSVDVIVGKTKANFPTRIAFRVASKVDSRTILDCIGADKLLGKGDMLLVDAKHPEPLRLHGAWLSEEELEKLVDHWKQYVFEESQLDLYQERTGSADGEETDPYFEDAREVILRYRQGSTSLLQRKLHVGYARAARILDQLEQAGVVGPPDGSKPREFLVEEETEIGAPLDDEVI